MRRVLTVLAMVLVLATPVAPAAASDADEIIRWAGAISSSDIGGLMGAWADDTSDPAAMRAIRSEIHRLQALGLTFDVTDCWSEAFLTWWDNLTLLEASMDLFDAGEIAAATQLMAASGEKTRSIAGLLPAPGACL